MGSRAGAEWRGRVTWCLSPLSCPSLHNFEIIAVLCVYLMRTRDENDVDELQLRLLLALREKKKPQGISGPYQQLGAVQSQNFAKKPVSECA